MMIGQIVSIEYKGKSVDKGFVIGKRKYRWLLKRKYEPCWAKNGKFISALSPHKKDFTVYIPKSDLKGKITIQDGFNRKVIEVKGVNKNTFEYEPIEEQKQCKENSILAKKLDPQVGF